MTCKAFSSRSARRRALDLRASTHSSTALLSALVAIEVLARLQGKGGAASTDSKAVDEWVEARKPKARRRADLEEKALQVIARILSDQSELRELWAESEHYEEWRASVEALRERIVA